MAITQIVDIPANRRITLKVPSEIPLGPAVITFKPKEQDTTEYLLSNPATRERLLKAVKDAEEDRNITYFETVEDAIAAAETKNLELAIRKGKK